MTTELDDCFNKVDALRAKADGLNRRLDAVVSPPSVHEHLISNGYHHFGSSASKKYYAKGSEGTEQMVVEGNKWAHHPKYN